MTQKCAYSYTVLRYVHDVVSGEALNVGVVLHAPSAAFLKVRTRKTIGRLKQVFPDLNREAFVSTMQAVDRGFAAASKKLSSEPLFDDPLDAINHALSVLPSDDSSLQWSPLGSGLSTDLEKTFHRLFERYVAQYDKSVDRRRTDEDIWRPVREKLAERNVHVPFEQKVVVGAQDRIEFKKAWKNGRWHAYEPVSFDLADADHIKDKARRWRGHLSAVADGSSDEVELHFVLGRPQDADLMHAFDNAKQILAGARFAAEVIDENDLDDFVSSIEDEYRTHKRTQNQ